MCLVSFALNQHPHYPLILIANRDEFLERPTAELSHWSDHPEILGGRDLEAGGTWLAVTASGKWGALTNFRDPSLPAGELSRGHILTDYFQSPLSIEGWLQTLDQSADVYSGFNLVVGHTKHNACFYYSNQDRKIRSLANGIYALSNGPFDDDWPKMRWLRKALSDEIAKESFSIQTLFSILEHPKSFDESQLPSTGIPLLFEKKLSSPFIPSFSIDERQYGTRSSSVLLATANQWIFHEKNQQMQQQQVINLPFTK